MIANQAIARLPSRDRLSTLHATVGIVLLIVGTSVLSYWRILDYPWSTGDTLPLLTGTRLETWGDLVRLFSQPLLADTAFDAGFYRPVALLSFAFDQLLWGANPLAFYLTNILIHASSGLLVYGCGRMLLQQRAVAILAALVFVAHPLAIEVVPSIARRQDLLACAFSLLSIYAILRWRVQRGSTWLLAAFVAYASALASKEVAVYTPLVALGCIVVLRNNESGRHFIGSVLVAGAGFALFLGLYLLARSLVLTDLGGYGDVGDWREARHVMAVCLIQLFTPQGWIDWLGVAPGSPWLVVPIIALLALASMVAPTRQLVLCRSLLIAWLLMPLAVCVATDTYALRSFYSAIAPFSLLMADLLITVMSQRRPVSQYRGSLALAAASALVLATLVAFSPALHAYPHWRDSNRAYTALRLALDSELATRHLAGIGAIRLHNVPSYKAYYDRQIPSAESVSYFNRYVIESHLADLGYRLRVEDIRHVEYSPSLTDIDITHVRRRGDVLDIHFVALPEK